MAPTTEATTKPTTRATPTTSATPTISATTTIESTGKGKSLPF